ncbi:hypothetical protein [Bacillus smithii]|uniref:hypothetical protein n=1 Tax=Bacillus smithii TaxID=1479 RepID=UPI0022E60FAC|nr:hypothetical protein [Bacillus smithii]
MKNRTETINFKDFMENKDGVTDLYHIKRHALAVYSLHPLSTIDVNFILIATGIVLVAICEKKIAEKGFLNIASSISSILRIAFPVTAAGSIIYLLSHAPYLL